MKNRITSSMKLGFFQLFPLLILFIVCYFILNLLVPFIIPTIILLHLHVFFGATGGIIAFICILLVISFFVGGIVRTTLGRKIQLFTEKKILDLIPGYKMLVEVFEPLKGNNEMIKGDVALARLHKGSALTTVYILDTKEGVAKTLLVCGGNPGMILVTYVPCDRLVSLKNINFQDSFKTLLSFGAGSNAILENYYEVKHEESL